jgi:ribose transport system ATP-binding protein
VQDQGTITYLGKEISHFSPGWARVNGINTIYQEIDLIPSLSAAENIFLGNEIRNRLGGVDWKTTHRLARSLLDDVGAHIAMDVPIGTLKLAHQQMVAIAKALSLKSKIIILDEPTAVFTSSEIELLFGMLRRLKPQGIGVIYISHHLDEIFEIGDRVTILRDGDFIRCDKVHAIDKATMVKAMVGRDIDFARRNGRRAEGEEVLRVQGLSQPGAFHDIQLSVRRGEIVGVAGLVGAGRTEVARALVGAAPAARGEVWLKGHPVHIRSPKQALDLGLGMLPESRKEDGLVTIRTIGENMGYSLVQSNTRAGLVPWRSIRARVAELIQALNVRPPRANLQVVYLSGGNQQKVVLGKWLAAQSDLLILDEPTRGVDVGARSEIYDFMQQLKRDGKAILMISSDMTEILTQSDRILVMAAGRIVGELSGDAATEERVLSLALRLEEAAA